MLVLLAVRVGVALDRGSVGWVGVPTLVLGYLLADLLSGTTHWFRNTFFDEDTPVIGPIVIHSISLDWLLIDILVLSMIFIPLELFWPKRPEQTKFHPEWRTDLVYLAMSHLLVQYTAVAIKTPAVADPSLRWVV